jgi:hypothetical protein
VVTDDFGNSTICGETSISVADTIVPVVDCKSDITVYLDAQASASLTAADLENTPATDIICGGSLQKFILRADDLDVTPDTTFGCAAAGQTYTLTLLVRDESNNAGTCTSTVTVRDTLLSHIGRDTIPVDENACIATLTADLDPAKLVTCSPATLTTDFFGTPLVKTYAGSTLSTGTHYVEWMLDDGQGTKTVTDTIVVKDMQKPQLTGTKLDDVDNETTTGCETSAAVDWPLPGSAHATDNCTSAINLVWDRVDTNQARVKKNLDPVPVGRWIIQYVAKDEAGNKSDTLSFFVIVKSAKKPVLSNCPGSVDGKDTILVAAGACSAIVPSRFTPDITLCPDADADSLSYAYTFNGGSAVTEGAGSLEGLTLPVGLYSVTYTATNKFAISPASDVCMFTLAVRNELPPQIACKGDAVKEIESCNYTVSGDEFDPTGVDGCSSYTFTHNYVGGGNTLANALLPVGAHTITWTATNLSGNTATCDITVEVRDVVNPEFTFCPLPVTEILLPSGACTTTAPIVDPVYSDNCAPDSLKWTISRAGIVRDSSDNYGSGKIRTVPPNYEFSAGTHVITYTVTDASGNSNTCSFTVPVKGIDDPTCVSVAAYTLKLQGSGITTLDPKKIDNGSFDNCTAAGDLSFDFFVGAGGVGNPDFTCADIGTPRPVRLRVTDVSGRVHTCNNTVITVIDTIAPTPQYKADTTLYLNSSGEVHLAAASLNKNSVDNCTPVQELGYSFRRIVGLDTTYKVDTLLTCSRVGSPFPVTVAVADIYGNIGTCIVQVTVVDTLNPVITFNRGKITVPTSGTVTGSCNAKLSDTLDPVITAGSDCQTIADTTNSKNTKTYADMLLPVGSHTVTWTVTSNTGLTATVTDTITVIDTLAPALTLPVANQSSQSVGECLSENPVYWTEPGPDNAADNCTSALTWTRVDAIQDSVVRGERVPVGVWKLKYVAKDSSGNVSDTVSFMLTIVDSSYPVLSACPSGTVELDIDAGECYATIPGTFTPIITGLQCGTHTELLTYRLELPDGTFFDEGEGSLAGYELSAGSYSATYTAYNRTDLSMTAATCSFDVVVRDTAAPAIAVHPVVNVYLEASGSYTLPMDSVIVSLSDNCTDSLTIITTLSTLTPNTFTCTDIALSPLMVTFTAKDDYNNESSRTFTVNVHDMIKPDIAVRPVVDVYLEASGSYTLPMDSVIVSLSDNCTDSSAIITLSTLTPNTFTCAEIGAQTATFTAKDEHGNESSQTFTVNVIDTIKPVVTCRAADTLMAINAAGDPVAFTAQSLVTAEARGCAAASALTYSFSSSTDEPEKTYTCATLVTEVLTVYVTDVNSNEASCTITVTVRDILPPVITKKDPIVATSSPADLTINNVLDEVTDNCGVNMATVTFKNALGGATFTCTDNIGWIYAEDVNGNKDSVVFSVVFDSSVPPVVTARHDTLYLDAAGKAVLSAYEVVETVTDNCIAETVFKDPANGLLTLNRTDFTCTDVGTVTVTISAQGSALSPGTATFTVTVLDTIKPTITCASDASVWVDDATCTYTAGIEFDPLETADNCSISSVLHDYNGGTLAGASLSVGTHTITWTVTDASGNTATCPVVITVNDHKEPVITCKTGQIAYLDNDGNVTVDAKDLVTVTDECAPHIALTYTFDDDGAGTHTYACGDTAGVQSAVIRVADLSGHSSTCTAQFTVRDTLPPVIVLKNPIQLAILSGTSVTATVDNADILDFTPVTGTKDNCTAEGGLGIVIAPQVYGCGTTTGAVTVTDEQGRSSSATFSVTFTGIPPITVTTASNVTRTLNASGSATLSAYDVDVVTSISGFCIDENSIKDPTNGWMWLSQSTFTCEDIGEKQDTIFVKRDASAAPETFTFNVTVHNSPPKLTCAANFPLTPINITEAKCDTTIRNSERDIEVTGSKCYTLKNDKNDSPTLVGVTFGIGTHSITWTVTDNDGHTDQCTKMLTVYDKHQPDIVCVSDTILALGSAGTVSVSAKDLLKSVIDCSPLTYTFMNPEVAAHTYSCANTGDDHILAVEVTDAAGNSSSCNATVRVRDTLPPQFTMNGNGTVTVKTNETLTPEQVIELSSLSDNCTSNDDLLLLITITPKTTFDCSDIGTTPATITVSDKAGRETSASFTVQVEAMKPAYDPVIVKDTTLNLCSPSDTLPENIGEILNVTVCGNASATVTYTNVSHQGTDKTQFDYYNYIIERTWTASAGVGNDSVVVQIITVEDTLKPVVVTASTLTVYLGQDGKGTPDVYNALISVTDCAADSAYVTIQYNGSEFSCSDIGTSPHTITVTAIDPSGNVSEASTVTVTVQDALPPYEITTKPDITLMLDASGAATLTRQDVIATVKDNCTADNDIGVTFSRDVFGVDDMNAPVPVWVYATDQYGNKDSVQVWITVVDDVPRDTGIEKYIQGSNVANRGDIVTFVIRVTNAYGGDRNLIIVDSLPTGLIAVDIPANSSVDFTGRVVTINHGILKPEARVEYRITARVEQVDVGLTNRVYLFRKDVYTGKHAEVTLHAMQPELVLTAKIREGDYTNVEASPSTYNVPSDYRLIVNLENTRGATDRPVHVSITYDSYVHQFVGSSRGGDVTDDGNVIVWTLQSLAGNGHKEELELHFVPRIAMVYTFHIAADTFLDDNPSDNYATVTVNQAIIKVPNVVTAEYPDLYIEELDNEAITEASIRVINTWGNQVYYTRHRKEGISGASWFNSANLARGTYWYELVVHYENGMSYVIKDYIEVLK